MKEKKEIKLGDFYYSIGVLQRLDGLEKWEYTGDKFDNIRMESSNFFETEEDAMNFKKYMNEYNAKNRLVKKTEKEDK